MFVFIKGITLLTILIVCADSGNNEPELSAGKLIDDQYMSDLKKNVMFVNQVLGLTDEKQKCSNLKFYMYTGWDANHEPIPTEVSELQDIILLLLDTLKIMIHGEFGHINDGFGTIIRKSYFMKNTSRNILAVDYKLFAKTLIGMPDQVNAVIKFVAKCTLRILNKIKFTPGTFIGIHIIAFNLGTQIAGSLADQLLLADNRFVMNRITALEPVLLFSDENTNKSLLHEKSATTVDVLYTNLGGFGQIFPIGTHTFYANGGLCQPECEKLDYQTLNCSHERAVLLFAESIEYEKRECGFFAKKWNHYNPMRFLRKIKNEVTDDNTYKFGEYMVTYPRVPGGVFYFKTNNTYPYAICDTKCSDHKFTFITEKFSKMIKWWNKYQLVHSGKESLNIKEYQISQHDGTLYEEEIEYGKD